MSLCIGCFMQLIKLRLLMKGIMTGTQSPGLTPSPFGYSAKFAVELQKMSHGLKCISDMISIKKRRLPLTVEGFLMVKT